MNAEKNKPEHKFIRHDLKPTVIRRGNARCQHIEEIVGMIGTCKICRRKVDYSSCQVSFDDLNRIITLEKSQKGQARMRSALARKKEKHAT